VHWRGHLAAKNIFTKLVIEGIFSKDFPLEKDEVYAGKEAWYVQDHR
jgi:hypothetical protein